MKAQIDSARGLLDVPLKIFTIGLCNFAKTKIHRNGGSLTGRTLAASGSGAS
jgi:hypothetical protein